VSVSIVNKTQKMQIFKLKLLIFMLLNTFKTYLCFNYDTSAPVFKQINTNINIDLNDNDIYFGYSIAQHFQKKDKQP
jgi:regulatory protein YycI of two-component signal transduction system YycFG